MSRSYRKTPVFGNTSAESDKPGRTKDHRRYRHYYKDMIRHENYDDIEPPNFKEEPWGWPKDGRHYWHDATEKDMRK